MQQQDKIYKKGKQNKRQEKRLVHSTCKTSNITQHSNIISYLKAERKSNVIPAFSKDLLSYLCFRLLQPNKLPHK